MKQANIDDALSGSSPQSPYLSDAQQRAFTALRETTLEALRDLGPHQSDHVYERTARQLGVNRSSIASVAAMFPALIQRRTIEVKWDQCSAYWMTKPYRMTMVRDAEKLSGRD